MKANMKGLGGAKGLLLLHGEKLGIAVVALLALWFIYGSLKLPRLESRYQASELQNQITQTNTAVANTRWPDPTAPEAENVRRKNLVARSEDIVVDPELFAIDPLIPAVISPTVLRIDPELLNAVGVRAHGGSGLFGFSDESIRRAQELRQREQERARQQEQERRDPTQPERPGRGRGGREQPGGEYVFDPDHPSRRPVEGMTQPAGIPLQGGERIERAYWACVVAKVPIREQMKRYEDAFLNAKGGYDPMRDFPRYVGYEVQRAEVLPDKPLEWQRVPLFDAQQKSIRSGRFIARAVNDDGLAKLDEIAANEWAAAGAVIEPVDERYIDPVLTLRLPPLVGRDFGADATHPDIPLAIHAPPLEDEIEETEEEPADDPADDDGRPDFRARDGRGFAGGAPRGPGIMGGGGRGFGPGAGIRGGGGFGGPEFGGRGHGGFAPEGGGRGQGGMGGFGGQRNVLPRGVDYWLLRFFDYTVEPGKKYKYRVRLVLADPNFDVPEDTKDPAVIDRQRKEAQAARARGRSRPDYRVIETFSEPSPTVGIPLAGQVFLAEATMPSRVNDEPTATMWARIFDIRDGTAVHVAKEKPFRRGSVVNLQEKMDYTGDGDRWIDSFDSYKLQTGMTLLDVKGAGRLGRDMTAPARVLLMDPTGELSIREELDDSTTVEYLRAIFVARDRRRGRPDDRGFPGGEFGPGYGPGVGPGVGPAGGRRGFGP